MLQWVHSTTLQRVRTNGLRRNHSLIIFDLLTFTYIPFMLSRSQLSNGSLLQVYLWTKYFILIKSVNLCAQKKP